MIRNTNNSPYISITGFALQFAEFKRVLPLMMADNAEVLINDELVNNRLLQINSQSSRYRLLTEIRRRYQSMPVDFWCDFLEMNATAQRAALFFAVLKTYKLVFDIHFNLTVRCWRATDIYIDRQSVLDAIEEIGAQDEFVNRWSEATKIRSAAQYLTMLRQVGLIEVKGQVNKLQPLRLDNEDYAYYLRRGDDWFLEACLLFSYEIQDIKSQTL